MRKIRDLLSHDGRVYVFLRNRETVERFIQTAAAEGITYPDRVPLSERRPHDLYALNRDLTVNYVNWIGHMAFYTFTETPNNRLVRVDFAKYIRGDDEYVIRAKSEI